MGNDKMKTTKTRLEFEKYLFELNKNHPISYRKHTQHNYENDSNLIIHLYYNDQGHIGTWQRGGHFHIFKENLPKKGGEQ